MKQASSIHLRRSHLRHRGLDFDFAKLSQRAGGLYRGGCYALAFGVVGGSVAVGYRNIEWLSSYLLITLPGIGMLLHWVFSTRKGLPLLPIFLAQHILIYGVPLVVQNPSIAKSTPHVLGEAGLSAFFFLLFIWGGWYLACRITSPHHLSRWNLGIAEGSSSAHRCLSLSFLLLGLALMFHLFSRTGLIDQLIPQGFSPVVRAFSEVASALGGLLGAMVLARQPGHFRTWLFWGLVSAICVLSVADVLISAASGIVIAVAVGLAFGLRRLPWRFLAIALSIIGFLNQGKFVMRGRYWSAESNATTIRLAQIPSFYAEWSSASADLLLGYSDQKSSVFRADDDDGQSIFDRVNNLQNLTYVIEVMEGAHIRPLAGETYSLIPKLLVPRFLWQNKPIAHEGQVLLNLHFLRQASLEQTSKTFIAWGLLPESVGNFGIVIGPVIVGLVLGFLIGWIETYSLRIRLFSVEGMVLLAFLMKIAGSYEMVASVLVTSTFQFLVATLVGGFGLYYWFGGGRTEKLKSKKRKAEMKSRMGMGRRRRPPTNSDNSELAISEVDLPGEASKGKA